MSGIEEVMDDATTTVSPSAVGDESGGGESAPSINIPGIISIVVFYLVVLVIGIWAGWRQRRKVADSGQDQQDQEQVMLAGRNIGLFVGILTMGATWVGGGFINGTAEVTYTSGLIHAQAPIGYGLSLFISGTFFARKMRDSRYVTMIDPFTQKYGRWGALQALPAAMSEIFWSASILSALGSTLQVLLHIDTTTSVIISAVIAVLYTLMGGLISVAYTDVFQLFFIAFGLFLALPFALMDPAVSSIDVGTTDWMGTVESHKWGEWVDYWFLLLLGGIPWQCYYQRVLSSKTSRRAQVLSYGGGLIALIMTVPSVLFGAIGRATDWEKTEYGRTPHIPTEEEAADGAVDDTKLILPLCLQYLTPTWVAFFGLGAISAAVMSSTDSSMLSASTMLARNVYKTVFRPKASEREVLYVLWVCIVINCSIATAMAIHYGSVYYLFVLCGDFVFVVVFPQLLLVIYYDKSNTYGSVFAFGLSLLLRLLCGDSILKLPEVITFGEICTESGCGPVPYRTIVMLIALISHLLVSYTTHHIFTNRKVDLKFDFLKCYVHTSSGAIRARSDRYLNEEFRMEDLK